MSIILALFIFSLIIIIHELGHFLLAKYNGVTVLEFSLGMGPRILSTVKGGTRYSWKLLPFGGSCAMLGEDEAPQRKAPSEANPSGPEFPLSRQARFLTLFWLFSYPFLSSEASVMTLR